MSEKREREEKRYAEALKKPGIRMRHAPMPAGYGYPFPKLGGSLHPWTGLVTKWERIYAKNRG
ncbi:hypothetical protein B4135_0899 [Caldibacillus debilis]|uniref:Uncharacterized protein n=1 Tax=Caldibacillus debilis TaxID=301148 RepID=A0A150M5V8_9BACI|nr:hypothetical protein B4135_0899 [Caldibacillus debilis]